MGRILVEQPNGKWAVWSTVVDDFIYLDCDESDLFTMEVLDAARTWVADTERRVRRNRGGNSPKYWDECLETRRAVHGRDRDFREDPFDGAITGAHPGNWTAFFEIKLAELCEAYYTYLMEIRDGNVEDPPMDAEGRPLLTAGAMRAHYEDLLKRLTGRKP